MQPAWALSVGAPSLAWRGRQRFARPHTRRACAVFLGAWARARLTGASRAEGASPWCATVCRRCLSRRRRGRTTRSTSTRRGGSSRRRCRRTSAGRARCGRLTSTRGAPAAAAAAIHPTPHPARRSCARSARDVLLTTSLPFLIAERLVLEQVLDLFKLLGRSMAKALQDNRLMDLPLNYAFYRCAPDDCRCPPPHGALLLRSRALHAFG